MLKRTIAYIIDVVVVILITVPLWSSNLAKNKIPVQILSIIVLILYFSLFEFSLEKTIGKWLTKIKIKSSNNPTFQQIFLRNISKIYPLLLLIDSLPIIFKKTNQRFLEKLSKTEVVDEKRQ